MGLAYTDSLIDLADAYVQHTLPSFDPVVCRLPEVAQCVPQEFVLLGPNGTVAAEPLPFAVAVPMTVAEPPPAPIDTATVGNASQLKWVTRPAGMRGWLPNLNGCDTCGGGRHENGYCEVKARNSERPRTAAKRVRFTCTEGCTTDGRKAQHGIRGCPLQRPGATEASQDDFEAHPIEFLSTGFNAMLADDATPLPLPEHLRPTGQVIDTGCSFHLENAAGEAGFIDRRPTAMRVQTGLTSASPCNYIGTHVQYVLGGPPGYHIVRIERPDVLMHAQFSKPLWSPRQSYRLDGTTCTFGDDCAIQTAAGTRIPFYDVKHSYVLPRWFDTASAEAARALLLARSISPESVAFHAGFARARIVETDWSAILDTTHVADNHITGMHALSTSLAVDANVDADPRSQLVKLWHARTGHSSPKNLLHIGDVMTHAEAIQGVTREQILLVAGNACTVCPKARMKAKPHTRKHIKGYTWTAPCTKFGDCISTDNAGPFPESFAHRYIYLTVYVDHHTSFISVYFQQSKGYIDSIPVRKQYIAEHARYGTISHFHSDAAQELMGAEMLRFLTENRITASWTVPGESDMNGRAEGCIGMLTMTVRAIIIHSGCPQIHWPAMYMMARFIRIHLPVLHAEGKRWTSRYFELTDHKISAHLLVVPCCVCHGLVPRKLRDGKLDPVAISGIFMGYPRNQPGGAVLIWQPNVPGKYFTAYSVKFNEARTYKDAWRLGKEISTAYGQGDDHDMLEEPRRSTLAHAPPALNDVTDPAPPAGVTTDDNARLETETQRPTEPQVPLRIPQPRLCRTPGCALREFHLGPCGALPASTADELPISQRLTRDRAEAQPTELPAPDARPR